MEYGIPLWVKGTETAEPGTQIAGSAAELPHRVTAIAHMPRVAYLALRVPYREDRRRLELELYKLMARVRVGFHLLRGSPEVVGFAVAHESPIGDRSGWSGVARHPGAGGTRPICCAWGRAARARRFRARSSPPPERPRKW